MNRYYSKKEASKILSVSERTIDRWIDKKFIKPNYLPNGRKRFREEALEKLLRPRLGDKKKAWLSSGFHNNNNHLR